MAKRSKTISEDPRSRQVKRFEKRKGGSKISSYSSAFWLRGRNSDPSYRKSIWPKKKVMGTHNKLISHA